jgi:hypothetical protein
LELRPPERNRIEDAANAPRRISMIDSWNEGGAEAKDAVTFSKALDRRQGRSPEVDFNSDPSDFQLVKDVFDPANRASILLVLLYQPYELGI